MPVHELRRSPTGHGELLCSPPFDNWAELARSNALAVQHWPQALRELREAVRSETIAEADRYSRSIGITPSTTANDGLVIMTGHQPELYHPGVWVKNFLVQRLAEETGAVGIDVVVDTDECEPVVLKTPCLAEAVRQCEATLVAGRPGSAYVQAPPPDAAIRDAFRAAGEASLSSLAAPSLSRHFGAFCDALEEAAREATDVGTLMTAARRRFERPAGTDYLEVLASAQARTAGSRV